MNNTTSREEDEEFERMVRRLDWAEHILPKCSLKSIDEPTDLRDYLKARGWTVLEAAIKDRLTYSRIKNSLNDSLLIRWI